MFRRPQRARGNSDPNAIQRALALKRIGFTQTAICSEPHLRYATHQRYCQRSMLTNRGTPEAVMAATGRCWLDQNSALCQQLATLQVASQPARRDLRMAARLPREYHWAIDGLARSPETRPPAVDRSLTSGTRQFDDLAAELGAAFAARRVGQRKRRL